MATHSSGAGAKLADYDFSDLYLAAPNTGFFPRIRGFRALDSREMGSDGLRKVPGDLLGDARELYAQMLRFYAGNGFYNEFRFSYDGVFYRVSVMDRAPGTYVAPTDRTVDEKSRRWHLRRLTSRVPEIEDLRFPSYLPAELRSLATARGLLLVAGAYGSGKSTTCGVSLVDWVQTEGEMAVTIEDPPELPLEGEYESGGLIVQVEVQEDDFASAVRASRRWAPRYVMLGEVRSQKSASELIQLATGGPMVVTTIHGTSVIDAIINLVRFASEEMGTELATQLLAAGLRGVLHQEKLHGRVSPTFLKVGGNQASGIQQKIRSGRYSAIVDDINLQRTLFSKGERF
ncbi:ATPase, T2SS/T4P/T4SS family [Amorphus sp. 3PC139-8]|uniref:ATPase, T2SS/T4P/T4SS family n=1 Tax=Amorphus sp. 3PC139-8 TaxID=2735676 RepID=UPI00345DF208